MLARNPGSWKLPCRREAQAKQVSRELSSFTFFVCVRIRFPSWPNRLSALLEVRERASLFRDRLAHTSDSRKVPLTRPSRFLHSPLPFPSANTHFHQGDLHLALQAHSHAPDNRNSYAPHTTPNTHTPGARDVRRSHCWVPGLVLHTPIMPTSLGNRRSPCHRRLPPLRSRCLAGRFWTFETNKPRPRERG